MEPLAYTLLPSAFGTLSIVWQGKEEGTKIYRIFLPNELYSAEKLVRKTFSDAKSYKSPEIKELGERIQKFFHGEAVTFELGYIALDRCSEFQRKVLLAEFKIPRGWVSTYGRIAKALGIPYGARAVGRALANNPFPIVIPCHRAIKSNGELGGFQGGLKMKRTLLELEGVEFSERGKVITSRIYY